MSKTKGLEMMPADKFSREVAAIKLEHAERSRELGEVEVKLEGLRSAIGRAESQVASPAEEAANRMLAEGVTSDEAIDHRSIRSLRDQAAALTVQRDALRVVTRRLAEKLEAAIGQASAKMGETVAPQVSEHFQAGFRALKAAVESFASGVHVVDEFERAGYRWSMTPNRPTFGPLGNPADVQSGFQSIARIAVQDGLITREFAKSIGVDLVGGSGGRK